jgi:hypothetical protein
MKKQFKLITEMSHDIAVQEGNRTKDMYVVGIFSSAEVENNNSRKYKRDLLNREVEKIQEKIQRGSCWGELGHPPSPEINPERIAILTESLEWKQNDLYGRSKILDTPLGNIAKTLVKSGRLGISSRGLGTVAEDGYVNEDYKLITWDLVTDPSNNPSWVNGIYEAKTWEYPDHCFCPDKKAEDMDEEEIDQIQEDMLRRQEYFTKWLDDINEDKMQMQCMECMKKFKKKFGPRTVEAKCPKCGSYDVEPA